MYEGMNAKFHDTAIMVILRVMRRKGMLKPADLTELRVALKETRIQGDGLKGITRLLDETFVEREERKESPKG